MERQGIRIVEWVRFCRDGILRRAFVRLNAETAEYETFVVSLRAHEKAIDANGFLKSLHAPIRFEDGLTVENLVPWTSLITGIAVMDFTGFLSEVRQQPDEPVSDI
jgi:hypothetical protein